MKSSGRAELGIYAAVLPISQLWQVISLTAAVSLAPHVARLKLADDARYVRTLVLIFRGFFYAGVATALVTVAVSGWLVEALFGAQYAEGATVLAVHAVSNFFASWAWRMGCGSPTSDASRCACTAPWPPASPHWP